MRKHACSRSSAYPSLNLPKLLKNEGNVNFQCNVMHGVLQLLVIGEIVCLPYALAPY